MIYFLKIFLLVTIANFIKSQSVVFDDSVKKGVSPAVISSLRRPVSGASSTTVDNIFQIPIAVIQGTSTAAQSWSPENEDIINKVFDIPVQTLQAISNLVKDRIPQNINNNNNQAKPIQQNIRRRQDHMNHKRHVLYNNSAWTSLSNLFFGGHGHSLSFSGIKKNKKRKMKKPIHHGNHGSHFEHHGSSHFQGHKHGYGSWHGVLNQRPQQILGGDDNIYHVTEDVDDAVPLGLWKPQTLDRIQNKIAPRRFNNF